MKRILTVQDLSCLGKCSLTVALPVLSAMELETAVLPTALLSTHTAFPKPVVKDLSGSLLPIADHWQSIGAEFDGIHIGYLGSARQVEAVLSLSRHFPNAPLLVDPVMGDNGRLYAGFDSAYVEKLRALCCRAAVLMPNLTEACLLTDTPYAQSCDRGFVERLLQKLTAMGCRVALITGVCFAPGKTGVMGCHAGTGEKLLYEQQKLPESYHGTGDLFSAAFSGALLRGLPWQAAAQLAADFTAECIRLTMELPRDKRFGVCFERALPMLIKRMEISGEAK